jgi:hypothetical protein
MREKTTFLTFVPFVIMTVFAIMINLFFFNGSYIGITDYKVNMTIKPDGSANIEERLEYRSRGENSCLIHYVDSSNTNEVSNAEVYLEKSGKLIPYIIEYTRNINEDGQPGTCVLFMQNRSACFKIYDRFADESNAVVIKYKLPNAVTRYKDIADFTRDIINGDGSITRASLSVDIYLPKGSSADRIKAFAHGSPSGEIKVIDSQHINYSRPKTEKGASAQLRVLFPPKLVPKSLMSYNMYALSSILDTENSYADQIRKDTAAATAEARKAVKLKPIGNILAIILAILWVLIFVDFLFRYRLKHRASFKGRYYRELPGNYTPAEMSYLVSKGYINARDILATLLDLVRKKQLLISAEPAG